MKLKTSLFYLLLILGLAACSSGEEDAPEPAPSIDTSSEYTPEKLGFTISDFDPLSIFTDNTCTALKAGVTDSEINACKSVFYKKIALYLKAGKYPSEFRIQDYKPYPHPDMAAKTHKTSPYSILDNPTGMAVNAGDELVLFVGDTGGRKLQMRIQDLAVAVMTDSTLPRLIT